IDVLSYDRFIFPSSPTRRSSDLFYRCGEALWFSFPFWSPQNRSPHSDPPPVPQRSSTLPDVPGGLSVSCFWRGSPFSPTPSPSSGYCSVFSRRQPPFPLFPLSVPGNGNTSPHTCIFFRG